MNIVKIEEFEVGFNRLRGAKLELAGKLELYEYKNATFDLEKLSLKEVLPTTYYALNKHLDFQLLLRNLLSAKDIDLFDLPGILYFELDSKIYGLVPPIIEIYEEIEGKDIYALQDGVHRFLLAQQLNIFQKCIVIKNKGADKNYFPYAYTNTWSEVNIYEEVPNLKKKYRREPNYSFMRPLRSFFDSNILRNWADYGRK